jgi:Tol biopolymer transport system component
MIVALGSLAASAPAQAAFSGANGKIAYQHFGFPSTIVVMNPDGTGQTDLTGFDPGAVSTPAWSPDGARIAFAGDVCECGWDIYVMNEDGTGKSSLTSGDAPAWSPDGNKIAFNRAGGIWIMNPDGTGQTLIQSAGITPAWSPDGTKIAFQRGGNIFVMNADGSAETQLTTASAIEGEPNWSPDGTKIAYYRLNATDDGT